MKENWYRLRRGILYVLSLLPFRVLYAISDAVFPIVYHIIRYRRGIVAKNLRNSFPEKSEKERTVIERLFYHSYCNYIVEMFKLLSISAGELKRRMVFDGMDEIKKSQETNPLCFVYLGHFCNWEWISSLQLWFDKDIHCAQLYHPLHSHFFNRLFYEMRTRFGSENISKKDALRRVMTMRNDGTKAVIGFISDQAPRWINIHDWVNFLNQDTPVFTGTERIAKKVNASVYYADVTCVKRGFYRCSFKLITNSPNSFPDYKLTEEYMRRLEENIKGEPESWLWSHNRWKRQRNKQ